MHTADDVRGYPLLYSDTATRQHGTIDIVVNAEILRSKLDPLLYHIVFKALVKI